MSTLKQRMALENIVENHGNIGQAMIDAGYSETTAHNPSNLTNSKGYIEYIHECGLTEQLVTEALVEDIKGKKGKRVSELTLGAEILGMRKMAPFIANQINVKNVEDSLVPEPSEEVKKIARMMSKLQGMSEEEFDRRFFSI